MDPKELAAFFDHTQLKPTATVSDFYQLTDEAITYGFHMVAINPAHTLLCKKLLRNSTVRVGAAIGFPLGQNTINCKVFEASDAIKNGADEIDYVINISELKNHNYKYVEQEMDSLVSLCRKNQIVSKVIFENCYLTEEEIETLCKIALQIRPDFIKTSTGFGSGGATVHDITLMKRLVGDTIKIKAAGGIRSLDDALQMISCGASRLGSSHSATIIKQLMNQ